MLLLLVLCLTVSPISAYAAGMVGVAIPVSVNRTGDAPSPEETYTFVLQAVEEVMPPAAWLDDPDMADEMRRPMMLLVKAAKP